MPVIPEWLSVSPRDFVAAAEHGVTLGQRAAAAGQAAAAEQSRLGVQTQLAHEREAGIEKEAALAREQRRWEQEQNLRLSQQQLSSQEARAGASIAERQQYHLGELGLRSTANDIAKQRADQAAARPGAASHMDPLDSHMLNDALIRRRQAETAAAKALESTASGGEVPDDITKKIKAADDDIAAIAKKYTAAVAPAATSTGSSSLPEGSRVRSKKTRKMGTVINGAIVPDPEPEPLQMSPSGVPMMPPGQGNTYGGVLPNEHFAMKP